MFQLRCAVMATVYFVLSQRVYAILKNMQIHLLTTLEFILNRRHYDYEHEAFVDNFNDDRLVFDRFDTVLKDIVAEFSYCGMMALSGKADDDHDDDSASATAAVACVGNDDEDYDTAAVADISDNGTVNYDEDEADDSR
ncbi:hypothetical protein PoB_004587800 [Plakobranchus ocellatus]|uniref:Uncharacterized protein n=1 Tax=Plakobranchus ocellatus TaxID=259542 RepID=A0AAV4BIF7_9GAST|nr:hypothetical protein PoB_004587800 [Plakobranchus ocellatus]